MVILQEYTFDGEAVLDGALRGRATLLSNGALFGKAPWISVENDVVVAAMDASEYPRPRWFQRKQAVPVACEYSLPEISRYLCAGDKIRVIRDATCSDEVVVTRGGALQFAVGQIGSQCDVETPESFDDSGYVTLAGQRLEVGHSRVVGDFEITLLVCGPMGIPSRPFLLAQGRREIPRATLVAWAYGVQSFRFRFP